MYSRILLAYDGTLEGALALREGALLARSCGAHVCLLSVVPETHGSRMAEGVAPGGVAKQIETYQALLGRAHARLTELGFKPDARLVVGEPAPVIGAVAKEIEADLVVVSHHRQSILSRWWSGSTSAYLRDHIACSLLIASNPMSDEDFEAAVQRAVTARA